MIGAVVLHGFNAHYHFDYVTSEQFEQYGFSEPTPTPQLDAGTSEKNSIVVAQDLPGLTPGVTYHYRLVATGSAAGNPEVDGNEETLTVPTPAKAEPEETCPNAQLRTGPSARLPDCRAYEQLTPVEKGGAQDIYAGQPSTTIPAHDGERVLLVAHAKYGENVDPTLASDYLFSRTPSGWNMTSDTPQPQDGDKTVHLSEVLTPNLTSFLFVSGEASTLFAGSHEVEFSAGPFAGPYVEAGMFSDPNTGSTRDGIFDEGGFRWIAQSRNGSTAIVESSADHEALGRPTGTTSNGDLYEFSKGQLRGLNVETGGATIGTCGAVMATGRETSGQGGTNETLSSPSPGSINSVSADGSRVFFVAGAGDRCPTSVELEHGSGPNEDLYMRVGGAETVDIGAYRFEGANPEGNSLFLSRENGTALEFFRYDVATATATHLFTIEEAAGQSSNNHITTGVLSEQGNVFYFRTNGQLTSEAPPVEQGSNAENVYRYDIETQTMRYIGQSAMGETGYYASPDGQYYYWAATSEPKSEAVPGVSGTRPDSEQVYRYDSAEDVIQCVSCASPFNPEPALESYLFAFGGDGPSINKPSPLGMPASANGDYVFFTAASELVPQDVNGEIPPEGTEPSPSTDVYEWRKNGVDGCTHVQGCLALMTNGIDAGKHGNYFLGTTESGRDVFLGTHSQLVSSDHDTSGDLYDARIDGGFPPPPPGPVECEGDACSTPASPPIDATPSSLTFTGPGNIMPSRRPATTTPGNGSRRRKCAKGKNLSHGRCVKKRVVSKARKKPRAEKPRAKSNKGGGR